jgi:hypothetical protein
VYSIFIELWVPMKLVRLIKIYLNDMNSKVCIDKHLCHNFPIQSGLKQGDAFQLCFRMYMLLGRSRKTRWD